MIQFNNLIHHLSRKLNWEVQVAAIPAGNKLEYKYHPLSADEEAIRKTVRQNKNIKIENDTSFEAFEQRIRGFIK